MSHEHPTGLSYKERIKPLAGATMRPECIGGLGGFGGLFRLPVERYREPVLVSGTDGVGTKLKLAIELDRHDTIGIDLVAMCVNDILVSGAEPLFFLDYYATAKLDPAVGESVIAGIAEGCRQAGAALLGGETAEMPGMYAAGDYDLAGFAVGVVEREKIIDGSRISPGDAVIGIRSSGPHSNGYSLIRRVLEVSGTPLDHRLAGRPLGELLLQPTRIYVSAIRALMAEVSIHGIAHITGGGLPGNLVRVLPEDCGAVLDGAGWQWPEVFDWLADAGGVTREEMLRTFNCGVGMAVVVPAEQLSTAIDTLAAAGEQAFPLGVIERGTRRVSVD